MAAVTLLPLVITACGQVDDPADYSLEQVDPTGYADKQLTTEAPMVGESGDISRKDQVGINSAQVTVNKLTDSSPSGTASSTPTEKTPAETTAAAPGTAAPSAPQPAAAGATTAAPAQADAPVADASSVTVNSVATVADDMGLKNDAPLLGVDPSFGFAQGPGFNVMGDKPHGSNLPAWYTAEFPELIGTEYWNAVLPWFVMFEGEGNQAVNTRVQMRHLKIFVLSRATNEWQLVLGEQDIDGEFCPSADETASCTSAQDKRAESSGGVSFQPKTGNTFHGWFGNRAQIDGADVKAVFVTMQSRLIAGSADSGDDSSTARYLIDVGADYYPDTSTDLAFVPGVGVSRAKLISTEWNSFNFMTFSDVGVQEPGGGITEAEFIANPPPMD